MGRKKLLDKILRLAAENSKQISQLLSEVDKLSIGVDIWAKKALTASFVGIVAQVRTGQAYHT